MSLALLLEAVRFVEDKESGKSYSFNLAPHMHSLHTQKKLLETHVKGRSFLYRNMVEWSSASKKERQQTQQQLQVIS